VLAVLTPLLFRPYRRSRIRYPCEKEGQRGLFVVVALATQLLAISCATVHGPDSAARLRQTANLIGEVKAFGKSIAIEPTAALSRTVREGPALSMLWLWMQREGTLALNGPMDIRTAIGYWAESERVKVERIYRVDGYSVYYRQGDEFADSRSVATPGFAEERLARLVKVVLHEDLHGDNNFALPWEIEEAIVTPLGSLAAAEYFRQKADERNLRSALASLADERQASKELNALVARAQLTFAQEKIDGAKEKILAILGEYPAYQKQFERQVRGQHTPTVLEAKLSHDLAYYRYFDSIVTLAESAPSLKMIIEDLKSIPASATHAVVEEHLRSLRSKYAAGNH
jgi:hypothetical protein